ncbi:MAG: hypothetical protein EA397_02580 [Deltaproteobacteria bacterium]|nr:MAG: hypothetical protein EA397_02580 [Deltaproteobacteria bacterium]
MSLENPFEPPVAPTAPSEVLAPVQDAHLFRGVSALHRDAWALIWRYPLIFVAMPLVLWAPFDMLSAYLQPQAGQDLLADIRTSNWITSLGNLVVGYFIASVALHTLRAHAEGEVLPFSMILAQSLSRWPGIFGVSLIGGLLTVLGLFLFVVPGVYVAIALTMALPALIVERLGVVDAIKRGHELAKTRGMLSILGVFLSLGFVYLMVVMIWGGLGGATLEVLGIEPGSWLAVLAEVVVSAPVNLFGSSVLLVCTLLYYDSSGRVAQAPVGQHNAEGQLLDRARGGYGFLAVAVATVLLFVALFAALVVVFAVAEGLDPDGWEESWE